MRRNSLVSVLAILSLLAYVGCEKEDGSVKTVKIEDYSSVIAECVDLGLSVKWASHNLGAKEPEGYGCYYAWGEIETKSSYRLENYRFRLSGDQLANLKFTKYNKKSYDGVVDDKTTLDLEDDVAHVKWGGEWRIPTPSEFGELLSNCTWTWTTQKGVTGYKVTSNVAGHENSSIFLPAAGFFSGETVGCIGSFGYYQTNALLNYPASCTYESYKLYLTDDIKRLDSNFRHTGCSVRPVCP